MKTIKLIWRLYPSYLAIVLLSLFAFSWYTAEQIEKLYYNQKHQSLEKNCIILRDTLVAESLTDNIDRRVKQTGKNAGIRITVINIDGKVLADSREYIQSMDNHSDRPEIKTALKGESGYAMRYSYTLKQEMMYVAVPYYKDNITSGVIRVSESVHSIVKALENIFIRIIIAGGIIALLAAMLSLIVSDLIQRPLKEIETSMKKIAEGDFEHRAATSRTEEFANLSETANVMAKKLQEKIEQYTRQRNEQEAILASMIEGVIAIDSDERIIKLNRAAVKFLDIPVDTSVGKYIHEVIRNTEILDFIKGTGTETTRHKKEIIIDLEERRHFKFYGTSLKDSTGKRLGTLMVFNDITRLKKLENIRREFVANVSHELKTPITSIKASAETLLDEHPDIQTQEHGFLKIIIKGADRLTAIIDDLLSLSRIEQQSKKNTVEKKNHSLSGFLETVIQSWAKKTKEKNIKLEWDCEKSTNAKMNLHLLEQAVGNLIDNAIKYSKPETTITISCDQLQNKTIIRVVDQGPGISREHLPRLFERFYTVDRARSRELGGTGLGLAIVKHIMEAHGGSVEVDSKPGEGSTFSLILPK